MHGTTFEGGCYPGTNIRLIRGGAPDAPASDAPKVETPAAESSADTTDYKSKYSELEGRYKGYDQLRHPTENRTLTASEIQQALDWGRSAYPIYEQHRRGELVPRSAVSERQESRAPQADPLDGIDDLTPREQVNRMLSVIREEVGGLTKSEMQTIRSEIETFKGGLGTQQQLMFKLINLARQDPDLDINTLVHEATRASAMGPMDLMDFMAKQLHGPKDQERAIAAAVEKAKAEWKLEQDAKRVPPSTRHLPRMVSQDKSKTPADTHGKLYNNFLERLAKASNAD
jgi:hypothetical protein